MVRGLAEWGNPSPSFNLQQAASRIFTPALVSKLSEEMNGIRAQERRRDSKDLQGRIIARKVQHESDDCFGAGTNGM